MLRLILTTASLCLGMFTLAAFGQPDIAVLSDNAVVDSSSLSQSVLAALGEEDVEEALRIVGEAVDAEAIYVQYADNDLSAAAGALYRALAQLDADERYELLHAWTMTSDSRSTIRLLTAIVPQVRPPAEFARLLGERPRDDSFPVACIHEVEGFFCSGWELIQAADEAGRLPRLTTELEACVESAVLNADVLLALASIADARNDLSGLTGGDSEDDLAFLARNLRSRNGVDLSPVVVVIAGFGRDEIRESSLRRLEAITSVVDDSPIETPARLSSFLQIAHATGVQMHYGESGPDVIRSNRLKYWIPGADGDDEVDSSSNWLVHEGHILQPGGSGAGVLYCRFPLTGDFEFSCEAQAGGDSQTHGGLSYGGLRYELGSQELIVSDAESQMMASQSCPYLGSTRDPVFNQLSLQLSGGVAQFSVNLHPLWLDETEATASPWLGLHSPASGRPLFRNLTIQGAPVIPREVSLLAGGELRGWRSRLVGLAHDETAAWSMNEGELHRPKVEGQSASQGLFRYDRPLLDGEAVSYEFYYLPGVTEVHPALGRLAFLIEPEGVRIHWITSREYDWTGLAADNAVVEPLNRRGPRDLPLVADAWNTVTMRRATGTVLITLNTVEIYTRPIDYDGDTNFGLYHDPSLAGVRVRNVLLTGDWPTELPDEFLYDPATVAE